MKLGSLSAGQVALCAFAALVGALSAWMGLSALSKPPRFEERVTAVRADLAMADRLSHRSLRASGYGPRAVCATLTDADLGGVRQALLASADQAGVKLTDLSLSSPRSPGEYGRIAPVALRVQGEAPYEALETWLDRLSQSEPEIFVDTLDLSSRSPKVLLKLTGKVFCWTRGSQS